MLRRLSLYWLMLSLPLSVLAWGSDLTLPPPAPVVDEFGLLNKGEARELDGIIRQIKQNSGVEIAIYIPATLQGREIEDFSISVAEKWQIGRKKEDKAFLMVIAPKERKMRLEVGYGLEGELTDAFSRRVLDDVMRPRFRSGDYLEGILGSLAAINQKVPLGLGNARTTQPSQRFDSRGRGSTSFGEGFLFFIIIVIFILFSIVSRLFGFGRRRAWYGGGWGGGSGWSSGNGGSSWGGGGGGFGGGGASSNW